ncbi:DinB family protein [Solitalea longa]|uniref:DinB family protein n=1 Tax=Solitalea longa TaxID=2079460 RepID=A0A2S5A4N8_9SPHI|nr:DinB family protein [Solitalea longa]POY37494.1 DinB family protein [Solitalea longa]
MITQSIGRLLYLCDIIPGLLQKISAEDFAIKSNPAKWSKKELLGHLIDSAANNHHRFIRARYEDVPTIFYDQNKWNELSHYNEMDPKQLIQFWVNYNKHLAFLMNFLSEDDLKRECQTANEQVFSLEFFCTDYVTHLEHHLHQLVDYD